MTQKGFTLIEIVVAFAVMAVLATVAVASFVNYSKIQVLQIASSELSSTLNLAKSRALSQTKPSSCQGQTLNGYKVALSVANSSYNLYAVCGSFEYKIGETSFLPQNVLFSPMPTSTSFFFPVIVSGVSGSGTIYLTAYGNTKSITVDSIGGVR